MDNILAFEQVYAGYGRINVLNGLSFEAARGQVLGVIGPNGSGKTTMLNVLNGFLRANDGAVWFEGKDISRLRTEQRCALGIGRTFQIPRPFERMRVFENVLAAAVFAGKMTERRAQEPAADVLRMLGLYEKKDSLSGSLTLLDRKRLEIARAIVARPKLLLLDEVAAGLTNAEVSDMIRIVNHLKSIGFTIIWIEHIMEAMISSADVLLCMAQGRSVVFGKPADVIHSKEVEELYLGSQTKGGAAHAEN